jgi:hypothetical protein
MPFRLHAVMQHPDDLDDARLYHAIEDDMYWIGDRRLAALVPAVPYVKAANAGIEFGAIQCRAAHRVGRDPAHGGGETCPIADAGVVPVQLFGPPQDCGDIGLRRSGKPISRHAGSTVVRRGEFVEIGVEVLVLDFGVFAAIERGEALLYCEPQFLELERFL